MAAFSSKQANYLLTDPESFPFRILGQKECCLFFCLSSVSEQFVLLLAFINKDSYNKALWDSVKNKRKTNGLGKTKRK